MAGGGEVVRKRTRDRGTCLLVHVEPSHIPWRRPPLTRRASCFQPSFARGGEEEPVPLSHPRASSGSTRASILPRRLFAALTLVKPSSTTRTPGLPSLISFFFFFSSLLPPVLFSPHRVLGIYSVVYSYKERKKGDVRLILNTIHIYMYMYIRVYIVPSTSIWIL